MKVKIEMKRLGRRDRYLAPPSEHKSKYHTTERKRLGFIYIYVDVYIEMSSPRTKFPLLVAKAEKWCITTS